MAITFGTFKGEIMTTKNREKMYQDIRKHGEQLKAIFGLDVDAVKLCKSLFRIEHKAHQMATDYCNGTGGIDTDNWDAKIAPIMAKVDKILSYTTKKIPVFLNGDARGYALKIDSNSAKNMCIHKDWGGYGIIAPDFGEGL